MRFKIGDIIVTHKYRLNTQDNNTLYSEVVDIKEVNGFRDKTSPNNFSYYITKRLCSGKRDRLHQGVVDGCYDISIKHLRAKNLKKLLQ